MIYVEPHKSLMAIITNESALLSTEEVLFKQGKK